MFIELRPLKKEDALISYKWRNDPEIWKYTGSKPDKTITPEIETEWIERVLLKRDEMRFAILADGKYVGNTYLTGIKNGYAEFHIFIGEKEYWNKGVATKALENIIEIAKKEKIKTLTLTVNIKNKAAFLLYTKFGFKQKDKNGDTVYMIKSLISLGGGKTRVSLICPPYKIRKAA